MKKNIIIKLVSILFIFSIMSGCTKSPIETEVINLVNESYSSNNLIIGIELKEIGKILKKDKEKYFTYTVHINYIQEGLLFGYQRECPESQCFKDLEFAVETELMIGKNEWDEWVIRDQRIKNKIKIGQYWRPKSKTSKEFYVNNIPNFDMLYATL
jgi:hypothetical protein